MMFAKYGRGRDLSLMDRFKLHNKQMQLGEVMRRSHAVVQDHLTAISEQLESDLRALVDMPDSLDYSLSLNTQRDQNSFHFRWFITVEKKRINSPDIEAFKITIMPHDIEYEDTRSAEGRRFKVMPKTVQDREVGIDHILQRDRKLALGEIKSAFHLWIARHCPDHAGLYFLDRLNALDDMKALHDKQRRQHNHHNQGIDDALRLLNHYKP